MSAASDITECRLGIRANRFVPVPVTSPDYKHPRVKSPGKQPFFSGWQTISIDTCTPDVIRGWETVSNHSNTGIITGLVAAVDADVPDQPLAAKIAEVEDLYLGRTPLIRVGKEPKTLRCYRIATPLTKRETPEYFHPDTRKPYRWLDQSPLDTRFDDLPLVDETAISLFLAACEGEFVHAGGRTRKEIEKASGEKPIAEPTLIVNGDGSFFRNVNNAALGNLSAWVKKLFPKAEIQAGTGAYRVSSDDLGRDYEEDLSIHPAGIQDFGPRKGLTPIDVVMEFGGAPSAIESARTLCDWLGRSPDAFGWKEKDKPRPKNGTPIPPPPPSNGTDPAEDPPPNPPKPKPPHPGPIIVQAGLRHEAADAGLQAMAAMGVEFYQRDHALVRVCAVTGKAADGTSVTSPGIVNVTHPMIARALGKAARFEKMTAKGEKRRIDPPKEVVEQIGSMLGEWPFHSVSGVIGTPTLRPDGSRLFTEGYDEATGLYLLAPPPMPHIPDKPTKQDALKGLALLDALLVDFPFVDEASRSVARSMQMTPVLRGALPPAVPIHAVTAPEAGTGKSYLGDTASAIAIGERCAVQSVAPKEEETEKRLIGAAMAGLPIVALDNCNGILRGEFLAQVSERPVMRVRPLGGSGLVRIPNTFTVFANGNNLTVATDLTRRTIQCRLDAKTDDTTRRTFKGDPVATVLADRGRYVAAVLTIALAYLAAGKPDCPQPLPSYERWSEIVCGALVWLGCADPMDTMAEIRGDDPSRQQLSAVLEAWPTVPGKTSYTTADLIDAASHAKGPIYPEWLEVMKDIARNKQGNLDPTTLGIWLRNHRDRRVGKKS